jgi:PAS domain S-box-containing protein
MKDDRQTYSLLDAAALNSADQKQAILSSIIAASDDAIISKTLRGVITSWNPAAEKMFNYTEADALGQHISLIIPLDRIQEEAYIIGEIEKGNRVSHLETVRLSRDGTLVPISLTVSPIVDLKGNIIGASKIARDISDRQRADQKQGILAAIVNTSDDAIISKKLTGIITSWNKSAEKMFGYTEEDVIGKHISLIIPTERLSEEQYIISEVSKGNKVNHFQTVRLARNGKQVPISLSVSPILDEKGNIIGASKIARDITEQLVVQEENARLYEQVKMLNKKKDEFIGLASHELKTPLTSINAYLQILTRMVTDERSKDFLKKARQQVKKVNALISDLLDVSKIEAGKLQLNSEQFEIYQLTADVIEMLCHNSKQFTISLKSSVKEVSITGDPHRIEQVIINLLTNAIRYSAGNRQIVVHFNVEENAVAIGVQDFGIGVPPDRLKDIFSKFFRVDDHNPSVSGLGIGLYLSQEIVLRHNGQIWAESELGKGSTFWFTLPR